MCRNNPIILLGFILSFKVLSESVMMMGAATDNGNEVYLVKVSTKFRDIFNIRRRDMDMVHGVLRECQVKVISTRRRDSSGNFREVSLAALESDWVVDSARVIVTSPPLLSLSTLSTGDWAAATKYTSSRIGQKMFHGNYEHKMCRYKQRWAERDHNIPRFSWQLWKFYSTIDNWLFCIQY